MTTGSKFLSESTACSDKNFGVYLSRMDIKNKTITLFIINRTIGKDRKRDIDENV